MKRRTFLSLAAATPIIAATDKVFAGTVDTDGQWRTFDVSYQVDLSMHPGAGRLWLPLPQDLGDYQRLRSLAWHGDAQEPAMYRDAKYGANIFSADWAANGAPRQLTVKARVAIRDRSTAPATHRLYDVEQQALYLQPTEHMPMDGIVAETSASIVQHGMSPDDKARAIYNWVVDNTFREPKTRGCGLGNIQFMLETGDLGGKCADINSLFVGLARAAGLPAREVYGVRVAPSKLFTSLGSSGDISKAQHCRAEYFSPRYGWVPVDPADVRKAVLQEKLPLDDPRIMALRKQLFGYWEMNWVGLNSARDFQLTPAGRGSVPYLMYPYAEIGDKVLDGRDPKVFNFSITSTQITA